MDPIIVPVLTALIGLTLCGIAAAELFPRLRWQERSGALTAPASSSWPARCRTGASWTSCGPTGASCTW